MENSVLNIEVKNPKPEIPNQITVGDRIYKVSFITELCNSLLNDISVPTAVMHAKKKLGIQNDQTDLDAVRSFVRNKFKCNINTFSKLSKSKVAQCIVEMQRAELIKQLRAEKWRESAILDQVNELFSALKPLTLHDLEKIRSYCPHKGGKQANKQIIRETARRIRNVQKSIEYTVTVSGPNLQYTDSISKNKVQELMRILFLED